MRTGRREGTEWLDEGEAAIYYSNNVTCEEKKKGGEGGRVKARVAAEVEVHSPLTPTYVCMCEWRAHAVVVHLHSAAAQLSAGECPLLASLAGGECRAMIADRERGGALVAVRTKAAAGGESLDMLENLGGAPITNVLCFCLSATSILQTVADFPFPSHWRI